MSPPGRSRWHQNVEYFSGHSRGVSNAITTNKAINISYRYTVHVARGVKNHTTMQYSPIARIVSADKGTKSAVVPYERAMSRISTAVAREDHLRVPTRPRRSSEHSHTTRKVAGGKGQESRAGVSLISGVDTENS